MLTSKCYDFQGRCDEEKACKKLFQKHTNPQSSILFWQGADSRNISFSQTIKQVSDHLLMFYLLANRAQQFLLRNQSLYKSYGWHYRVFCQLPKINIYLYTLCAIHKFIHPHTFLHPCGNIQWNTVSLLWNTINISAAFSLG